MSCDHGTEGPCEDCDNGELPAYELEAFERFIAVLESIDRSLKKIAKRQPSPSPWGFVYGRSDDDEKGGA